MRALNYLKNSVEYSLKNNGMLRVTQNHIDALNEIIEYFNNNCKEDKSEQNLSEALLLFYILQIWKIDNENGKIAVKDGRKWLMELSNPYYSLEKLLMLLNPKERVIDELFTEIRTHQLINNIPREKMIKKSEVINLLEGLLATVKNFKPYNFIKHFQK